MYSNEPGFTRELKMPEGVGIEAVLPVQEGDTAQPRRSWFRGRSPPGIEFANHHGARRVIRLDPMTGFPRVESVEIK